MKAIFILILFIICNIIQSYEQNVQQKQIKNIIYQNIMTIVFIMILIISKNKYEKINILFG